MGTIRKTFDVSKFQKSISKSISNISTGFNDPDTWISTGNFCLNKRISGDFNKGIPLGKMTCLAGESGCLPETASVLIKFNNFKKEVSVGDLNNLYNSGLYDIEIDTPDGWQKITEWFNKGTMPMVLIETEKGLKTYCATNHALECISDFNHLDNKAFWMFAGDIKIEYGYKVLTKNGWDKVINVVKNGIEECYDFTVDHINHRYWGDNISSHNSAKSLLSASIIKNGQKAYPELFTILLDSENSSDRKWLENTGVDTSPEKLLRISVSTINGVAKIFNDFFTSYRADYMIYPREERPKFLIVIDSLSMLLSETEMNQFNDGDLKGDKGTKQKALKALITNCVNTIGEMNIGVIANLHTMKSQDMYQPDDHITGGSGPTFASSIIILMNKSKLKEDEEGVKTTDVNGIRSRIQVVKTRYAKPFVKMEIKIPYDKGIDPYSGLLEYFESIGVVEKQGNKLYYKSKDGTEYKEWRKDFGPEILDKVLLDWDENKDELEKLIEQT